MRGSFGSIPAEDATALALILTELVTNAVEHGFDGRESGTVEVIVDRQDDQLRVEVADDGSGLPAERGAGTGLGTQIVSTLVTNEMRGTIEWASREGGGTSVVIEARLRGAAGTLGAADLTAARSALACRGPVAGATPAPPRERGGAGTAEREISWRGAGGRCGA